MNHFELGIDFAKEMDKNDPMAKYSERFYKVEGEIYMDGNSMGSCSKDAENALLKVVKDWKEKNILFWEIEDYKYFRYSDILAEKMAPLLNADPKEVVVVGSTTSNIHQALATFYQPTKDRYKILVDDLNFPSDRYAVDSIVRFKGYEPEDSVKVVQSVDGVFIDENAFIEAMTDEVAVVLLPSILYRSAQLLDMKKVTDAAKERGIYVGWDLCHSIGAIDHDFKVIDPDFAVWCNYKYISNGPGGVAGLFINKKHFDRLPGLNGWFGNKNETQFKLLHQFEHQRDASGWQIGTPHILSMAPLEGVLEIFHEAGIKNIREASLHRTAYLMYLIDQRLVKYGYSIGNPREDERRGGHVSLEHDNAYQICLTLKAKNVIPDFREPNVIRLAPIALYNSYEEIHQLVDILEEIGATKEYEKFSPVRGMVV